MNPRRGPTVEALAIFLIVLALITLVGHGIWVVLAWIVRLLGGRPSPRLATELDELAGAARRLRALVDSGRLSQEVIDPVLEALRDRREELLGVRTFSGPPLAQLEQVDRAEAEQAPEVIDRLPPPLPAEV